MSDTTNENNLWGYWKSIKFYYKLKKPEVYEPKLLSYTPFYPNETATKSAEIINTDILMDFNPSTGSNGAITTQHNTSKKEKTFIHEFCIHNKLPVANGKKPLDIVLVHGYGAALGFFYRNFDALSDIPGSTLHALDLNGFGLSGRPKFPNLKGDSVDDVLKSEAFYVDALEQWRLKRGVDEFVLMGHSMGGYLSCCYYLKFGKGVVKKLVLISPVGVEDSEFSLLKDDEHQKVDPTQDLNKTADVVGKEGVDVKQEVVDPKELEKLVLQPVKSNIANHSTFSENDDIEKLGPERKIRINNKWIIKLWNNHYSPFQVLRAMAPVSPKFMSQWTYRRFEQAKDATELLTVFQYTASIFLSKGSGEYGLTRLLAPGALAKLPLIKRVPDKIKVPTVMSQLEPSSD
ncbi:unnamed protein product [Ambrosiozyma monospora]|uniref:Unnamed protein product n=1 Tax=Ambrosiozyma monospora TaxID=43982 RepID=A0ACB5T3A9_AMBMO|nr:unnamed protein product [Ambrosiozyma monospora]